MTSADNKTIFIDGEAGTTGLQIRDRLANIDALEVKSIDQSARKDPEARAAMMHAVDLVVLCLPDDAAREAVALADALGNDAPKIVDASTAHRTAPNWVYGFAEMTPGQSEKIANAKRVANPGCYPTGAIALLRPLIENGAMAKDLPVTVNAVSGYSGGGRAMIESYESGEADPFVLYGLSLTHKHLPELKHYADLTQTPIFVPSVGNFRQGMLVSIPLHLGQLTGPTSLNDLQAILHDYYKGSQLVSVATSQDIDACAGSIAPDTLNGTDKLELFVFGNKDHGQALLVARLDNLGKGAAGAAVQNIKLMLGLT